MSTLTEIQASDIAELDIRLLAAAMKAFQDLTWAADGDIYTDSPEYQVRINRVQDAIQAAYKVLIQIQQALNPKNVESVEILANRILDEAEEAFATKSLAEERALDGECRKPKSIQDYLFWIEDEARVQAESHPIQLDEQAEQRIYTQALQELAQELRQLGFTPSPSPWQAAVEQTSTEAGGGEL